MSTPQYLVSFTRMLTSLGTSISATASLVRSDYDPQSARIQTMIRISIQDLKARLSSAVADAESGNTIVITRHNEPVAQLGPPAQPQVRLGSKLGKGGILPALRRGTKGRYLAILLEDRRGR
jgi:prevent-host-death family protein